jgi:uncharacterized protein YfiM (DUF2279 family)
MPGITTVAVTIVTLLACRPAPSPGPAFPVCDSCRPVLRLPEPDRWLAADKLQHLTMSFAATSFGFAAARSLGIGDAAAPAAAALALAAGIGKEVADLRAGGAFSLRDLAWDAAGVLAGYALARNGR